MELFCHNLQLARPRGLGEAIWGCVLVGVGCSIIYYNWFQEYNPKASPSVFGPETAMWRMNGPTKYTDHDRRIIKPYVYWALITCQCKFVDSTRSSKGYFFLAVSQQTVNGANCWEATRWVCECKVVIAFALIPIGLDHLGVPTSGWPWFLAQILGTIIFRALWLD